MIDFSLLDYIPNGAFVLRQDYTILFWNSALEFASGLKREEMISKNVLVHFPHLQSEKYLRRIQSIFEGGPPTVFSALLHHHVIPIRNPIGGFLSQHTTVMPIYNEVTEEIFAVITIQDVSDEMKRINEYRKMRDKAVSEVQERKRVEQELLVSERKFRTISDFAYDWEYWMSPDEQLLYVSPACEKITGYRAEQFLQDTKILLRLVHHDDFDSVVESLHRLYRTHDVRPFTFRIVNKSGELRHVEHVCQLVYESDGMFLGFRGTYRDITEQKEAEERLHRRDNLLEIISLVAEHLMHAENVGYIHQELIEQLGGITGVSRICVGKIVYKEDAGIGLEIRNEWQEHSIANRIAKGELKHEILPQPALEAWRSQLLRHRIVSGEPPQFVKHVQTALEQRHISSILVVPLFVESMWWGVIVLQNYYEKRIWQEAEIDAIRTAASIIETSFERQKNEETLRTNLRFLETLIDTIPHPVYYKDTKLKITGCNSVFVKAIVNKEKNSLIGKRLDDFSQILGEGFTKTIIEKETALLLEGGEIEFDEQLIRSDETRFFRIYEGAFRDAEGNIDGLIGIFVDVTEQRRAEQALIKYNEELNAVNAAKNQLFSIIAHDLKSPFTALLGFSELLANDAPTMPVDEIEKYSSRIFMASRTLLNLIENLMIWSRSQTGKLECTPIRFDIVPLIRSNIKIHSMNFQEKDLSVQTELPAEAWVRADINMIDAVVRNLLANAIKFTKMRGKITVSVLVLNDTIQVCVLDTGIGITEDMARQIFSSEGTTVREGTKKEKGTGLGLQLAKEFVERNGGKIWAESSPNAGASFYFTLPAAPETESILP